MREKFVKCILTEKYDASRPWYGIKLSKKLILRLQTQTRNRFHNERYDIQKVIKSCTYLY